MRLCSVSVVSASSYSTCRCSHLVSRATPPDSARTLTMGYREVPGWPAQVANPVTDSGDVYLAQLSDKVQKFVKQ
jgi:hypothetical protein